MQTEVPIWQTKEQELSLQQRNFTFDVKYYLKIKDLKSGAAILSPSLSYS